MSKLEKAYEELLEAAKAVVETVTFDVIGDPVTGGGNGGLTSDQTVYRSGVLRATIWEVEKLRKEKADGVQ